MHLFRSILAVSLAMLGATGFSAASEGQSARAVAAGARVSAQVEPGQMERLRGHVPAWATAANDLGQVSPVRRLENLHLVLARSPPVQAAFDQLLADQQDPASPRFHQWLTPQQNAQQYGIAPADVAAVTGWLQSQGLSVDDVALGGTFITFSGPVSVVENAFSTKLHNFTHENAARYAPTMEPAVPVALAGLIQTVAGLSEHVAHIQSHALIANESVSAEIAANGLQPLFTTASGSHFLSPGDFNTIYDIDPTLNAGINGSGTANRVVNLIDSRIAPADITGFNSVFGLAVAQPNQILLPGSADPGISSASEGEATLDVQRILGTAPGAGVDLLVFANLGFTNIFSALQYEVGTLNDPIVNMSFGACNSGASLALSQTFDSYFKTGAAQGISFFVASGDNAAAGCDAGSATIPAVQELATNLICASSYATCVGGTEFAEGTGSYWGSNSANKVSATGYIPEGAWDEPTFVSAGKTSFQASGTGGGVTNFPKPSWQTGTGVPADGVRDVPDVSFTAAFHDGYLICQLDLGNDCSAGTFKFVIFGTSASSPSMAGIAALLDQKLGGRQGNLNLLFYKLAATPANGVFHDVTVATSGVTNCSTATPSMCNNSTPSSTTLTGGVAGYAVGTGYDLATGLGSMDVTNFLAAAVPSATVSATTLALTASANPITTSQTVTLTVTLTSSSASSTPTGSVQFSSNGSALGAAVLLGPTGIAAAPALTFPVAGTYSVTAAYFGDGNFSASTSNVISLVVNSLAVASFSVAALPQSLTVVSGATTGNTEAVALTSINGFAGTVALTCSITPSAAAHQPVCSVAATSVVLGAGGTANAVVTIATVQGAATHASRSLGLPAGGVMFAVLLCLVPMRRRPRVRPLMALLLFCGTLSALTGCGSGGTLPGATTFSSAGGYTVTVTGTAAGSATASTASTTFTLVVN
ncbi:MAG: protease pro-enzyme activation domain-containing protein [Acidobacteriaceae bacterium]